jgi:hypothetical protein
MGLIGVAGRKKIALFQLPDSLGAMPFGYCTLRFHSQTVRPELVEGSLSKEACRRKLVEGAPVAAPIHTVRPELVEGASVAAPSTSSG